MKKLYYISDLSRLDITFAFTKVKKKTLFHTFYTGDLVMDGKIYHAAAVYNIFGAGYLLGVIDGDKSEQHKEIHAYVSNCILSGNYPAFEKGVFVRNAQKFLFGLLFFICLSVCIYMGREFLAMVNSQTTISFLLPVICCIVSACGYINACRL